MQTFENSFKYNLHVNYKNADLSLYTCILSAFCFVSLFCYFCHSAFFKVTSPTTVLKCKM